MNALKRNSGSMNHYLIALCLLFAIGCAGPDSGGDRNEEANPTTIPPKTTTSNLPTAVDETTPETNPVVATVGPMKFYLNDVLKLTQEDENQSLPMMSAEKNSERTREVRKETLRKMIDRRLLILGSAQHPEWVSDASWEEQVQQLNATMGVDEIERRRSAAGITMEEFENQFRKFVREEMMIRELVSRKVESATPPTEAEMRERYEQELETTFTRPQSWAVYHIDRYLPRDQAEDLPGLMATLEEARAEVAEAIREGTTPKEKADLMMPLVRVHSEAKDAQVGYAFIYDTPKANFDAALVDRVRTATLGELSPVFPLAGDEKQIGGSFFLVFENRPGDTVSFETAKKVLEKQMVDERRKENRDRLFAELEGQFPVEVFEEVLALGLNADPESNSGEESNR